MHRFIPADSQWLTLDQVADRLGCSQRHVRNLIARGELAAYRMGKNQRTLRVRSSDIETLMRRIPTGVGPNLPTSV